jgi:NADH:ubiquinone oxidoreductase subunit F (NADH-binding)
MYTALGYDFQISSITEMLRVCKQIRIFPLCDLDSNASEIIDKVIAHFRNEYEVDIKSTNYEFQKGANKLLIISN